MAEKVLAVGGGGREHAIVDALARSGADVYAVMKNRNPGIARLALRPPTLEDVYFARTQAPGET